MTYTLKFKNIEMTNDNFSKYYIYNNGEILAEMNDIQNHVFNAKNELVEENKYLRVLKSIYFNSDLKRSIKLNLNRKDNFYILNKERTYSWDPSYVLYINVNNIINFEDMGDVFHAEIDNAKHYFRAYQITFSKIEWKKYNVEKIPFDGDYNLQEKEKFDFSQGYGIGKENAHISYYDHSKLSDFARKRLGYQKNEKGIIKRWTEEEIHENETIITRFPYFSKIEKNETRLFEEAIASIINDCLGHNSHISHYDVVKLLSKLDINIKEGTKA